MKINISQTETYEINMPKEIDKDQFLELLTKLDAIAKIIKTTIVVGETLNEFQNRYHNKYKLEREKYIATKTKKGAGYPIEHYNSKEKVMDILQYFYHGTEEDKQRIAKIVGKSVNEITYRLPVLIQRHKIKPEEVGLFRFKNFLKRQPMVKMQDYTIKSYTGIFDETE